MSKYDTAVASCKMQSPNVYIKPTPIGVRIPRGKKALFNGATVKLVYRAGIKELLVYTDKNGKKINKTAIELITGSNEHTIINSDMFNLGRDNLRRK